MSPADSVPFVTSQVNGEEVQFAKLTPNDIYVEILSGQKRAKKLKQIENLKLMEIPPDQWLSELEAIDDAPMEMGDFIKLVNDPRGKIVIVDYAWKKQNSDHGDKKLVMTGDELQDAIQAICLPLGITWGKPDVPPPPVEDGGRTLAYGEPGEGEKNPPRPLAYGQ